jgi:hypothetical protein
MRLGAWLELKRFQVDIQELGNKFAGMLKGQP